MNTTTLLSVALIGAFLALFIVVRQLLMELKKHPGGILPTNKH